VPDGRDDGRGAGGDRPHDALVAPRQEIFERAAAARDHDDVDLRLGGERGEARGDRPGRRGALHRRLGDEHPGRGKARGDGGEEVAAGGGVGAGQEPDAPREDRERPLALGREEPLGGELGLQPLDAGEEGAEADRLDRERAQAERPAGREELGPPVDVDGRAVGQVEPERVEGAARHRRRERRASRGVLQREEDALPARVPLELGHLALDPDGRQPPQPARDALVEGGHGVDLPVAVQRRLGRHPANLPPRLEQDLGGELGAAATLGDERHGLVQVGAGLGDALGQMKRVAGLDEHVKAPALDLGPFVPFRVDRGDDVFHELKLFHARVVRPHLDVPFHEKLSGTDR
jgi:hypothetical protein